VLAVDASVAVKWLLPEVHSDAALRILEHHRPLLVPDLLFAEVGNVLWKRVRRREATIEVFLDRNVVVVPLRPSCTTRPPPRRARCTRSRCRGGAPRHRRGGRAPR
jgi:hypothetical protein